VRNGLLFFSSDVVEVSLVLGTAQLHWVIGAQVFIKGGKLLNMSLIPEERKPEIRSAEVKYFNIIIEEISKGCLTRSHKYVVSFFIPKFFQLPLQVLEVIVPENTQ
jgi:hypothetical protein